MHNRNRWINYELWHCTRRLAGTFPASMEKCWYAGCVERCGGRPSLDNRPALEVTLIEEAPKKGTPLKSSASFICAWKECEEDARSKSKYCSRDCSNKNARWRHKTRKAA